jgi:ABC-type polysaccharide/polyol phosphate transport system ATPase subunit
MNVVEVRDLRKVYRHYQRFRFRAVELMTLGLAKTHQPFWALDGLTLEVPKGEVVALVGENGCGKSTLLKILAGTCYPSSGQARVAGRVAALLELGTGFHPHFSGRDNALLQASLHGLDPQECRRLMPFIEEFAGLGEGFDQMLRTYSTGMVVRLAFAAAVAVEPDLLLVDEALAVGDAEFQQRCLDRLRLFKEQGRTIIFVSHNLEVVRSFCSRAVLMERGRMVMDGHPSRVCEEYERRVGERRLSREVQEVANV